MEDEYDWNLILKCSVPAAIAVSIVYYLNTTNFWKLTSLILGCFLASLLVYINSKKKQNIFTASAVVFLAYITMKMLIQLGVIS